MKEQRLIDPLPIFPALAGLRMDPVRLATSADLTSQGESTNSEQKFAFEGRIFFPLKDFIGRRRLTAYPV